MKKGNKIITTILLIILVALIISAIVVAYDWNKGTNIQEGWLDSDEDGLDWRDIININDKIKRGKTIVLDNPTKQGSEDDDDEEDDYSLYDCDPDLNDPCDNECKNQEECVISDVGSVPGTKYACSCETCTFSESDGGLEFKSPGTCTDDLGEHKDFCIGEKLVEYHLEDNSCLDGCQAQEFECSDYGENWECDSDDGYCIYDDPWSVTLNCFDDNNDGVCDTDEACISACSALGRDSYNFGNCKEYNPSGALSKEQTCGLIDSSYKSDLESSCVGRDICCCTSLEIA
jgi:hypothetical protein